MVSSATSLPMSVRLAGAGPPDDGDDTGRPWRCAAEPRAAARLAIVVHRVDVVEHRVVGEAHLRHGHVGQRIDDAMTIGREQGGHGRQAARAVDCEERLAPVAADRRKRGIVARGRGKHSERGLTMRKGDVGSHGEDRLSIVGQRRGDAYQRRRSGPGVLEHVHRRVVAEVELLPAADDHGDLGEEPVEEREVARQQCLSLEHEEAFVHARPPAGAAGDEGADAHIAVMLHRRHCLEPYPASARRRRPHPLTSGRTGRASGARTGRGRRAGGRAGPQRPGPPAHAVTASFSILTAQTLNSAVLVTGSYAELVSSLTGDSL